MRAFAVALVMLALASGGPAAADEVRLAPELRGERWLNSAPLRMQALRGKVVLVSRASACWRT